MPAQRCSLPLPTKCDLKVTGPACIGLRLPAHTGHSRRSASSSNRSFTADSSAHATTQRASALAAEHAACPDARLGLEPLRLHPRNETVPLVGQALPSMLLDARHANVGTDFRPRSSLIMVVHNAAPALAASLPRIFNLTLGCTEMLLLLDQCTDDSYGVILRNIAVAFYASRIRRVRVVEQLTPIWEAASENILMSMADPLEAYVLIQPDNLVAQRGWDVQLARPLSAHADVIGVSGMVAHAFGAATPTLHYLKKRRFIRDPGYVEAQARTVLSKDAFYVRDTGSRGPLLLHAKRAQLMGFFDHELFWLEDSDHEFFCRASFLHGWAIGAVALRTAPPILQLKTRVHGERAATAAARNESSLTFKRILARAAAVRKIRGSSGCLHNASWIRQMHKTPPRSEYRPLPLMQHLSPSCEMKSKLQKRNATEGGDDYADEHEEDGEGAAEEEEDQKANPGSSHGSSGSAFAALAALTAA